MIRIPDAEINSAPPPRTMLMNEMHPPTRVEATQRWISPQNSDSDTDKLRGWQTQAETEQLRPSPLPGAPPVARFLPVPPSPPTMHTPPTFATMGPLTIRPPLPPHWPPVIDGPDTKNGTELQRDRRSLDEYNTTSDDQTKTDGTYLSGVTHLSSQNRPQHPYTQHERRLSYWPADVDLSSATSSVWKIGGTGMTNSGHPYVRDYHMSRTSPFGAGSPGHQLRSPQIYQGGVLITAFAKIKIFRSSTDEWITVRVSPRVVLGQLMKNVGERLGSDVKSLKYHDGQARGWGGPGEWVDILNDVDLKSWMASTDELALYTE